MLLRRLDDELPHHPSLRIENNSLVVGPLKAEDEQPSLATLEALVDARLPLVELPDLLMEVDGWTGFSRHLEHAGGAASNPGLAGPLPRQYPGTGLQLWVNPNGAASGLVVPAARLVHHLVFARGNASISDREHRQPPLPSSIGPSLGWRHALLLRWTTFSGSGSFADCDRNPALLRLWHGTDILYVDLGSVLAVW